MTYYKIQEHQLQGVINYLVTKPYMDVAEMLKMLVALEKITPEITDAKVLVQDSPR